MVTSQLTRVKMLGAAALLVVGGAFAVRARVGAQKAGGGASPKKFGIPGLAISDGKEGGSDQETSGGGGGVHADNGCVQTGIPGHQLANHPLSSDTITNIATIHDPICNPDSQAILKYIVSCALPASATISTTLDDGTKLDFHGGLGITPEWGTAPCNVECQEWVTACLASRINVRGVTVQIFLTGPGPGRGLDGVISEEDHARYPVQEGAFYGNLLGLQNGVMYSCRGYGHDPYYEVVRVCAQDGSPCGGITNVGTCDFFDGATGLVTTMRACEGGGDGTYFTACHGATGDASGIPGKRWTHPITIFTKQSDFGPHPDGGC